MVNRITGLSTGMDIEGMVEKLMTAERAPLDKAEQKQQLIEWKQDAYREVNRKNLAFDQKLFSDYKLKEKWTEADGSYNADKIFDKIKKFVEDYNANIEFLSGKVNEPKYRDYQPLTDAQRDDMKDKDIERWEEKAMSGLLRRDPTISSTLSKLRTSLYESADGAFGSLVDLGITTTKNWLDGGKLQIDEKKLKEKLAADPSQVVATFTKTDGAIDSIRGNLSTLKKGIEKIAGTDGALPKSYSLGKENIRIEDNIDNLKQRLIAKENMYWKQFNAMEKAIAQMNAQSNMMFNMFSQG